ncbi:MAG: 5'-3' exonuclease [Candidatus Nanopelagicales bacterium]|nr:5'-3' exonuclease [Candidatus Nanopelagicales bacterium]
MPGPLMLLDTASLYFRAFFGVPDRRPAPSAPPTNAASGLLDMIARLVRDHQPDRLIACWDDDWRPAFRVDLIPSYKEHRVATGDAEEVPDALAEQIPLIEALLVAIGVPRVGVPGFEADDVIGTYATVVPGAVDIVTGDRDLFQLVDDDRQVRVLYTARGIAKLQIVDEGFVREKYGVTSAQYADMAALRGDPSDGLPGVRGVGEKTAASLLRTYGSLSAVRAAAADLSSAMSPRLRASLAEAASYLDVAPQVVAVARDLPVPPVPDGHRPDMPLLEAIGEEFGLQGSIDRVVAALAAHTSEE